MKPQDQEPENTGSDSRQPGQPQQPDQSAENQPQVVYMARPLEPMKQPISPEIQQWHEQSKQRFPKLNLSEGEYVISAVKRHPIGLVGIWTATGAVIVAVFALVTFLSVNSSNSDLGGTPLSPEVLVIPAMLISILALLFAFISSYIYKANRFYLTNESVIQHIQTSLFDLREQTISLANIEDASYSQDGIFQHLLNYGLIRLSTQGDETTYRFNYASNPNRQIATLNDAVENFKNIRPMHH